MSRAVPNLDTIKGHGLKANDLVDFYGLGKDGLPSERATRCKVTKVGNGYMLISVTDDLHIWDFGFATKVYAAKVDTVVEVPSDFYPGEMIRVDLADPDNYEYVTPAPAVSAPVEAPKAEVVRVDAVEVTGAKIENVKWLGMVPESLTADPANALAFGDYNLYVRWSYEGSVRVDRSDDDRMIVANGTRAGKLVAFREVMVSLATFYGVPVVVAADPGITGRHLAGMAGTYLPRDSKPTVAPVSTFNETDPATWHGDDLPQGYEWVEVAGSDGEFHLMAPDGRDLSEARYAAAQVAPVTLALGTYVEITDDHGAVWTYSVTRFDEFWVGLRKVGTWRDGLSIRTDNFRAGLADGSVKVVEIVPTPTVEDVAAMTGDPVGWVNGLMAPTNTPVIDGYYWKRHTQPGEHITALSTYQLVQDGTSCQVAATVKYTKDGLWQANGCVWISTALTPGSYWDGEPQADAFAHVVQYMTWVASVRGSGLNWADINRLDWRTPYVKPETTVVAQGEAAARVTVDGCPWHALECDIWAGTDTMRQPMRTKVNKRSRKAAKRSKRHSLKRGA